jgi:hypothetical protein
MLTLNTITLFYHEILYSTNDKLSGLIESWSTDVKKRTAVRGRFHFGSSGLVLYSTRHTVARLAVGIPRLVLFGFPLPGM